MPSLNHVTSNKGLQLIKHYESCRLAPYKDSVGVPTIGWGNTFYENGAKVRITDKPITQERADQLLANTIKPFENDVSQLTKSVTLTQNEFDALVCFAYNVGSDIDIDLIAEGLGDSTLLKKVLANPKDQSIPQEFLKWNKAGGKVLNGLTYRRRSEAHLYMYDQVKFFN